VETELAYYNQLAFTYNADGIRTSKTVDGIKHTYVLEGSKILAETWTKNGVDYLLVFLYDENGAPIGMKYRTSAYTEDVFDCFFFEKNLQGDIIAVYNSSGTPICTYKYDAWGAFTTTVTSGVTTLERSIANTYNPFRYRGYFYDVESGYYYLQSRYYNPNWGRFLNADGYVTTGQGILSYNMYAYCNNNPVMCVDKSGDFFEWIVLGIVVGCLVGATVSDVKHISEGDVSVETTINESGEEGVRVNDSYKIKTPWVQFGYSFWLNHINKDTKDIIAGTTTGVQYEWAVHNVAYVFYSVLKNDQKVEDAKSVDVGRTIFADSHGKMSDLMQFSYMSRGIISWVIDFVVQ